MLLTLLSSHGLILCLYRINDLEAMLPSLDGKLPAKDVNEVPIINTNLDNAVATAPTTTTPPETPNMSQGRLVRHSLHLYSSYTVLCVCCVTQGWSLNFVYTCTVSCVN